MPKTTYTSRCTYNKATPPHSHFRTCATTHHSYAQKICKKRDTWIDNTCIRSYIVHYVHGNETRMLLILGLGVSEHCAHVAHQTTKTLPSLPAKNPAEPSKQRSPAHATSSFTIPHSRRFVLRAPRVSHSLLLHSI